MRLALGIALSLAIGLLPSPLGEPARRWAASSALRATRWLAEWHDRHDGLGTPCSTGVRQVIETSDGYALAIPACWSVDVQRVRGVAVHSVRDPAPGLGEALVIARSEAADPASWKQYLTALKQTPLDGTREIVRRDRRTIVRLEHAAGTRSPFRIYEWHAVDGDRALGVRYRVEKVFIRSPKILQVLATLAAIVAEARPASGDEDLAQEGS